MLRHTITAYRAVAVKAHQGISSPGLQQAPGLHICCYSCRPASTGLHVCCQLLPCINNPYIQNASHAC